MSNMIDLPFALNSGGKEKFVSTIEKWIEENDLGSLTMTDATVGMVGVLLELSVAHDCSFCITFTEAGDIGKLVTETGKVPGLVCNTLMGNGITVFVVNVTVEGIALAGELVGILKPFDKGKLFKGGKLIGLRKNHAGRAQHMAAHRAMEEAVGHAIP